MVDALSKEAIRDQQKGIEGTLCYGINDIRSRMYFDDAGEYQYLTYDRQECGGYVSIVPFNNTDGSIQYRPMTFDELHNAVIALLTNPKATTIKYINSKEKEEELKTTDKAAICQIIAQYFYICSRMESDLDLIIMERFWRQMGNEPIKNTEKLNPLVELNKQLHVKLDLKKLSFPVSRDSFYHKLYVTDYSNYQQSTRDAAQFHNVISKIKKACEKLGCGDIPEADLKYEYIKAASSVMSHSKAAVGEQEIPVGITCNIPFCQQTYAFEAVKDFNNLTKEENQDKLTELLKTLYLNRILNSKGRVVTIGMPLNFIDALDTDSKNLYKKIAQQVLMDLVKNAETYGIKDKLIVADGFDIIDEKTQQVKTSPTLMDNEKQKVKLVFAGQGRYPITALAGLHNNMNANLFNYDEIQVYQSGDIVLVKNNPAKGQPKYCVNGQVKKPKTEQFYTEEDIKKFEKLICTYEVKEVSLDALGDHLGAVGRYCSNYDADGSADGVITGLPGVIDGLYGLGNLDAIADYQKKYTELQEINAQAIAKQIFEKNQQRQNGEGNYFDFDQFVQAQVEYTANGGKKTDGNVIISLLQIINQEKYTTTTTEKGVQFSVEIVLSQDRRVILGVGNNGKIQYGSILANTANLQGLLETILDKLDIKDNLSDINNEQAKQVFEKLLNLLHKEPKLREINNLIFAKTIEFLKTKPTKRQELAVELKDISAAFLRNTQTMRDEIIGVVSGYLDGLKQLDLSEKNIFDPIEKVFAYYRENGADNLNTNQMLDFYGAFYNAVLGKELESNGIKYKIIDRDGKKFIIVKPEYLKDKYKALEDASASTPQKFIQQLYTDIIKNNKEELQQATLVMPSLTDYQRGGHYVAYLYSGGEEVKTLDSLKDKRQESALPELGRHFGSGAGFCGLHAVEAIMALTKCVQLIGKNEKDGTFFEIDANGNTTSFSKQLEKKEEIEEEVKPAESINEDEETLNRHFVPKNYKEKPLSEGPKFLHISDTGLKIKPELNHKNSNFVIVNAGNGDIESENLCLKLGGSGLNAACRNLYSDEQRSINEEIKKVSEEAIDKGSFKISEYAKGKHGEGRYVGCIFVQLEEQKITHLYAIGPRYEDFRDKDKKVNKKHFFEDLKFTNNAIFGEITSHYTELTGKTIFFSGVSNNIFAGGLQNIRIKDIKDANIVDYFNAFCFMQFIQEHGDELKQHNIHIYLNKSISVALEALYNEETRQSVLDFLNENVQTEEQKTFSYNPESGFELKKKEDDGGDGGDGGYGSGSEDDTEFTDDEEIGTALTTTPKQPQTTQPKPQEFETLTAPTQPKKGNNDKLLSDIIRDKIYEINKETAEIPQSETRTILQEKQIEKSSQIKVLKALKSMAKIYEQGKIFDTNIEFKNGEISPLKNSPEEAKQRLEVLQKIYDQSENGNKPITIDTKIEGASETYSKKVLSELFANEFLEAAKKTINNPNNTIYDFEITRNVNTGVLTIKVEGIGEYVLPKSIELGQVNEVVQAISEQNETKLGELRVDIQSLTSQSGEKMNNDRFQAMLKSRHKEERLSSK